MATSAVTCLLLLAVTSVVLKISETAGEDQGKADKFDAKNRFARAISKMPLALEKKKEVTESRVSATWTAIAKSTN